MHKRIRIAKFAAPYTGMILLAIVLLFVQVNLDLMLPDYLSDIVDTGIQQGGVANTAPMAYSQSAVNHMSLFWDNDTESIILGNYTLIDNSTDNLEKYGEDYPSLLNQSIYILNDMKNREKNDLYPYMVKGILANFAVTMLILNPSIAEEMGFNLSMGFNITSWDNITYLPAPVRMGIADEIYNAFSTLGDTWIDQITVTAIKAEYVSLGVNMNKLQLNYMLRIGGLMLLFTLLSVTCTIIVGYFASQVAARVARDVRQATFKKVEDFSSAEFDKFSTASLITRSTNDVTQLQMMVFILIRMVAFAPIMGVGGIIRALGKAKSMWWIIAIAVLVLVCLVAITFIVAYPKFKIMQKLIDRLNLVTRENLSGMMVIRAFNRQNYEEKRFDKANFDLTRVTLFTNRMMVILMPVMFLVMNVLTIGIIWVGRKQIESATIQVGDMMAFLQYAMQIVMAFLMMSIMFIILPRASVSATRIKEILNTEPTITDPVEPKTFPKPSRGKVEFRNVSFRYPRGEEYAISNISFTANPGETTAFIGGVGSGKSTIVNLIPRFYDVSNGGAILVDGIDIRDVKQHDLRELIGLVPQNNVLFSGTVESNLHYGNENASLQEIEQVIEVAQAKQFVNNSTDGLARAIAQGGKDVSGGQKQRLSIARALVKHAPILIFDDSFSALDFKTDKLLRQALKKYTGNSTVLIVTQRVSTVMYANQIIVLDDGKMVGKGTHKELMETCETYKEIALSQLKEDALL
jgi:ATP-binding cassette subfamily B multidrug efflux pump